MKNSVPLPPFSSRPLNNACNITANSISPFTSRPSNQWRKYEGVTPRPCLLALNESNTALFLNSNSISTTIGISWNCPKFNPDYCHAHDDYQGSKTTPNYNHAHRPGSAIGLEAAAVGEIHVLADGHAKFVVHNPAKGVPTSACENGVNPRCEAGMKSRSA